MRLPLGAKALGLTVMCMLAATLAYSLEGSWRQVYLPGRTTDGHYQIELACKQCHSEAFSDRATLQQACVRCHGAELTAAQDSHPEKKFRDPRNADRIRDLDARFCVTCHREHRPELTSSMGLSLPTDYCFRCHSEIGNERPSHQGLAFDSCASSGCHHFHDNRALYEDFLVSHLHEPEQRAVQQRPPRMFAPSKASPLAGSQADAPERVALSDEERQAWAASTHARGGVNCSGCHQRDAKAWNDAVADETCGDCHTAEQSGFRAGRHGMRVGSGLDRPSVADARAVLRPQAAARSLGCTSCHSAHAFDTRRAAVDACLGCHSDRHSLAYRGSAHERHWLADDSGRSGASCATCHLPREHEKLGHAQHNQNDNLRPADKMLRGVCLDCHGLGFAIDAIADRKLVLENFKGRPARHVASLEMAEKRLVR